MPMAVEIVSHNKRYHVVPHSYCHNVRNVVVPLTMLMAPYDAYLGDGGRHDHKSHVSPNFNHLDM